MGVRSLLRISLLLCLGVALLAPGCSDSNGVAVVTVAGQPLVVVGTTAPYTAKTTNASDTSYGWTTSDPVVATIDATGVLTAHEEGPVIISAVGSPSGAVGTLTIQCSTTATPDVPFFQEWSSSPHNDKTAEAFVHWDDDGQIPTSCAKCHSTHGFRDFLGDDGTAAGVVDNPAALGSTVECGACHNATTPFLKSVTFPSGVTISGLGREATCMTCHQGRASTESVDDAIAAANPPDDDTVMPDRGFINVHYFPAAATRYGSQVMGGYLYTGQHYDVLFRHVPGLERCQDCHNPHTLKIKLDVCADCHNVSSMEDLKSIRMISSITQDYDGDGDKVEGLYWEIDGLRGKLLQAIQAYAQEVVGMPIVYDGGSYPYFFNDTNGNGSVDPGEGIFPNRYISFTARLLKATYNYQYGVKDPGGFAHNGKFVIQLLHDSINDLNTQLTTPVDMTTADRNDVGHFDGTAEAFRYFDNDGQVRSSCAKCHSGSHGYDEFLIYGTNTAQPIANGFDCAVCHTTFDTFETRRILQVEFPGGKKTPAIPGTTPTDDPLVQANMCITCHQGRTSKQDIDDLIAAHVMDPAANRLSFQNVHYLAAAATLFGTEAQVGYEYAGKMYEGKFPHVSTNPTNTNHCVFCHDPVATQHTFRPERNIASCRQCHRAQDGSTLTDLHDIRLKHLADYDGDGLWPGGMTTETLRGELQTMAANLLAEIQDYADNVTMGSEGQTRAGHAIEYDPVAYPYFFKAGLPHIFPNRYTDWDGKLLRAAHNYQHTQKETGAWAHNFPYVIQLCYDAIENLGGDVSSYTRP